MQSIGYELHRIVDPQDHFHMHGSKKRKTLQRTTKQERDREKEIE